MAQYMLDIAESLLVGNTPKIKQRSLREKHLNTFVVTTLCIILANIPLFRMSNIDDTQMSTVSFRSSNTFMHLGTQPFVFASFVQGFWLVNTTRPQSRVMGFLLSLIQSLQWGVVNTTVGGVQLVGMSYLLLRAILWLDDHGSIGLSTALIFATASQQMLLSIVTPVVFAWTCLLLGTVTWLESLAVTVPLTHKKSRHQTSMPIPLLYNSTTALVIYFTMVESMVSLLPPLAFLNSRTLGLHSLIVLPVMFGTIWVIDKQLPQLQKTTAKTLVNNWKEQSYSLKGWRLEGASRFVQKIIDNNVQWGTAIIFLLWLLGSLLPPSCSITTLFIVVATAKQFESGKWSSW
jgi:hypothetical protein